MDPSHDKHFRDGRWIRMVRVLLMLLLMVTMIMAMAVYMI